MNKKKDLKETLKDICHSFHLMDDENKEELALLEIQSDCILISKPSKLPKTEIIKGYIQKLSLNLFYAIEGTIDQKKQPGQRSNTIRIKIDLDRIKTFDRRIYPRYVLPNQIEAVITSDDESEALFGYIVNLSPAGLRVEVEERLYLENTYNFSFEIELGHDLYTLKLRGKPVSETRLSESFVYGVWLGDDKKNRKVIKETDLDENIENIDLMTLVDKLIKRG